MLPIISSHTQFRSLLQRGIAIASLVFIANVCSAHRAYAAQENKTLPPASISVVLDDKYPPYIFRDLDGNLQGILKDTWDLWSRKSGIEVKLKAMDWGMAQAYILGGHADVIDTIFETEARLPLYDFSKPYVTLKVPIFFHKSISGISDANTVRGFTVGVKDGDACIDWLTARGVKEFKRYPSYEAIIASAKNNDVRVFCIDEIPALYFLNKENIEAEFRSSPPLYSGQFHWATKKGNAALHQVVAQGFDRISDDERKNIERKWLGEILNQRNGAGKYSTYIGYSLLLAVGISMGMLLWNWALRRRVSDRTARLTSTLNNLRASQEHFEAVVATTPVGVFETDIEGSWTYVNERWLQMSGLSREQTMGDGWIDALHVETREQVLKEWAAAIQQNLPFKLEFRLQQSDDGEIWVLGQASSLKDASGKIAGYIGSMTDITDRKFAETEIEFLAYHDPLTELPNRLLLKDRMMLAMAHADRAETKIALVFLDLDKFKTINDSLGHSIGDVLLKAVSKRLLTLVRDTDTVSRLGGDEFLILLADIRDPDTITELLERALKELADTIDIEGIELSTTMSMGIAIYPDDGRDFDTLLKSADTAMYCAKEAGRNTYRFFTERMNLNAVEHLQMRNSLRRALERGEFVLHYQPQINLTTGRTIGVEALIRWNHPEFGMVLPGRFISIAEDTGLIVPIGDWVLREACRQGMAWRQAGLPDMVIAVNLSAEQFKRGDLVKCIADALEESGFDATFLELELTESILIHDSEIVLETVQRLKSLGLKLSIDDFGTGYSSLAYLKRFNVNKLKIDQSFVRGLAKDSEDAAIVHAIIQMARSLNLTTIAEGVEDENVAALLRLQHCDEAQGYYFARPMPADAFTEYATAANARAE